MAEKQTYLDDAKLSAVVYRNLTLALARQSR